MPVIRVLLADDHALFRQGLASLLAAQRDFEVVGEAGDGRQAVELARDLEPDVVLMDVSMPAMDGLEATRRMRAERPAVRVVILTVSCGTRTRLEAEASGARACLPKGIEPEALYDALRDAVQGASPGVTPPRRP
jgi:DNA-binding NarL/FixJ family response regulator